ncbi:hypothetical protein P9112_009271 [Eukaryota sp. TZLM1-RC]
MSGDVLDNNHQRFFERILLEPVMQLSNEVAAFVLCCGLTSMSFPRGSRPTLLVCLYRYFGLSRDEYPEYSVAIFSFSQTVKLTRKKRTKKVMKEGRAAGLVEDFHASEIQDNTAESHHAQKTRHGSKSATKASPECQRFLCGHGPQSQ